MDKSDPLPLKLKQKGQLPYPYSERIHPFYLFEPQQHDWVDSDPLYLPVWLQIETETNKEELAQHWSFTKALYRVEREAEWVVGNGIIGFATYGYRREALVWKEYELREKFRRRQEYARRTHSTLEWPYGL